jgi:hypothetical protein
LLAVSVTALHVVAGFGVIFAVHRLLEILDGDDDDAAGPS